MLAGQGERSPGAPEHSALIVGSRRRQATGPRRGGSWPGRRPDRPADRIVEAVARRRAEPPAHRRTHRRRRWCRPASTASAAGDAVGAVVVGREHLDARGAHRDDDGRHARGRAVLSTPPTSSISCSFGTITSVTASSSLGQGSGRGGIEDRRRAPSLGVDERARSPSSSGTSSCASTTAPVGDPVDADRRVAFAPGTTTIVFSPSLTDGDQRSAGRRRLDRWCPRSCRSRRRRRRARSTCPGLVVAERADERDAGARCGRRRRPD